MEGTKRCRKCGQARPAGAPGELCPLCLLESGAGCGPVAESEIDQPAGLRHTGPGVVEHSGDPGPDARPDTAGCAPRHRAGRR